MAEFKDRVVSIYTEQTPNPETLKFVINAMLYSHNSIDFPNAESVNGQSPLADFLFESDFVRSVFISNNFVTIGKAAQAEWIEIIPEVKKNLVEYLKSGKEILNEAAIQVEVQAEEETYSHIEDSEMVGKIKDLLQKYVQPAVSMDGGAIVFKNYQDGVVTLGMQGACSGCPSSTITLKAGIEGMMKRMIPEVKEVVAEAM